MSKSELYYMNKYEKAKVIGLRALQLSSGAEPMVRTEGLINPLDIAKKELMEYKMPFIIRRKFPDGKYIDIKATDMIIN
jgi:DNA-directed RNA polymerase I, II, and III subunit RPABC2